MRPPVRHLSLLAVLLFPTSAFAAVSPADISRAVTMVFAGKPGAAGGAVNDVAGDVNADGRTNAADVVGAVLGMRSPTQPGPFAVGFRHMTFTKKSASHPDEDRVLETAVWYPTTPDATGTNHYGGIDDAPLAADAQHLPLLMFSHGSCGYAEQSVFLTALVASYGFIVASPPHPGNTIADLLTLPGCGSDEAQMDSFLNREADIVFVIDTLLQLNADPGSFLHDAIDPARIGMSGHSFGGHTTLRVCADDSRVIAGLALAPAIFQIEEQIPRIAIPMMIQDGLDDTTTEFEPNAQAAYDLLHPPRYLVAIADTGHYAFSDKCFPGNPDCGPGKLTQTQAHLYVQRYAVPFLLQRVAGDHQFDAFLDLPATPPGVTYSADAGT